MRTGATIPLTAEQAAAMSKLSPFERIAALRERELLEQQRLIAHMRESVESLLRPT